MISTGDEKSQESLSKVKPFICKNKLFSILFMLTFAFNVWCTLFLLGLFDVKSVLYCNPAHEDIILQFQTHFLQTFPECNVCTRIISASKDEIIAIYRKITFFITDFIFLPRKQLGAFYLKLWRSVIWRKFCGNKGCHTCR